jgi:hypothetical protein
MSFVFIERNQFLSIDNPSEMLFRTTNANFDIIRNILQACDLLPINGKEMSELVFMHVDLIIFILEIIPFQFD